MAYINDSIHYVYRGEGHTEDQLFVKYKSNDKVVAIPFSLFDELVVMRYAQLEEGLAVEKIQKRASKKYKGSKGAEALERAFEGSKKK